MSERACARVAVCARALLCAVSHAASLLILSVGKAVSSCDLAGLTLFVGNNYCLIISD